MDTTHKQHIAFGSLAALLVFLPFFEGGRSIFALLLSILLILPVVFFSRDILPSYKNKFVATLGLFILAGAVSLSISPHFYASFYSLVWWCIYFLVFVSSRGLFEHNKEYAEIFAKLVVGVAIVFGVIGIFTFLNDTNLYLRMRPIFGQHNAFAGFLILPLCISFGYTFKNVWKRNALITWSAISAFLMGIFVLTFSRGAFLALLVPLLIGIAVLFRGQSKKTNAKYAGIALSIIAGGCLIALLLFSIQNKLRSDHQVGETIIFQNETADANGVSLRMRYWSDALHLISQNPFLGVGLGNYGEGIRVYKKIDGLYVNDPHNLYLRLYAEVGVVSLPIFIFFILLLWEVSKRVRSDMNPLELMIALGVLGLMLHNFLDIDWWYPANALVFFVAAGMITSDESRIERGWWQNSLVVLSVLVFLVGFYIYKSVNHLEDGKFFVSRREAEFAENELKTAAKFNYFKNPEIPYEHGRLVGDIRLLNTAIEYAPRRAATYSTKAEILKNAGDEKELETTLQKAIEYNRGASYVTTRELAMLYIKQGKFDKAQKLVEENLVWFEEYSSSDFFLSDPNKDAIRTNIQSLRDVLRFLREKK